MEKHTEINEYWKDICNLHLLTKHYALIAEELALNSETFLQPMKEHRDAYDHIIRVYSAKIGIYDTLDAKEAYMLGNMSKALGHEYRAFFDTADWISIIIKERLNGLLDGKNKEELKAVYPDYPEFKKRLLDLPEKIASIRENKDIGKGSKSIYDEVLAYQEVLDSLISDYKELALVID